MTAAVKTIAACILKAVNNLFNIHTHRLCAGQHLNNKNNNNNNKLILRKL